MSGRPRVLTESRPRCGADRQGRLDMGRRLALLSVVALVGVLVSRVWAQPSGKPARDFQGYWMGVDPVDGGDARRSLIQLGNGKFALAGRDTVLSLCDGT